MDLMHFEYIFEDTIRVVHDALRLSSSFWLFCLFVYGFYDTITLFILLDSSYLQTRIPRVYIHSIPLQYKVIELPLALVLIQLSHEALNPRSNTNGRQHVRLPLSKSCQLHP